ncbi:MAG TPA: Ldh family oxidoreductase [Hyphomicrobiaceae bacterium]|nr:Ldh family oxidoreductase [Hyphomicrobiaceae bacterium]
MNTQAAVPVGSDAGVRVPGDRLGAFCRQVLIAAGALDDTASAATRAMLHGSRLGIDSHGVRLLDHYVAAISGGRVNARPRMRVVSETGAVAALDADDAHGALAAFTAMGHAVNLAGRFGIGAVAIRRSSHFGPAGAYALAAAEAGSIGLAFCNADSIVRLHGGASRFHGTNPIACAVPVAGSRPWLLDMATSAIPYNRVQLYKSVGRRLPGGVASTADGSDTDDPERADMLAPLGGAFGYKGAGLAGLVEILSAVLSGMNLSPELAPMSGPDFATPRKLGAFVMALAPAAFLWQDDFHDGMKRYLSALRGSPARGGESVLAPGDREWAEADRRAANGIPIDPDTEKAFRTLASRYGLSPPFP